jgi:acetyl esterase/lipase
LEECYAALRWIQENGASISVDTKRIAVAGDSAGGNLSVALSCKQNYSLKRAEKIEAKKT